MHQPVSYSMQILADFIALQPVKESFPGSIMIRQVQFFGRQVDFPPYLWREKSHVLPDSPSNLTL